MTGDESLEERENSEEEPTALDALYAQGLSMTGTITEKALTSEGARDDSGVRTLFSRLHGPMDAVRHGDKESLRDHLVLLHAPLVEHCARNFLASGEPLDDLVQEGYVGLIKAVDRFDPSKGVRFSTYACHLIMGEIRHYLRDLGRLIHEPGWHFELRQRISRTNEQLAQKLGRTPEPEDIARALNIEPSQVREVIRNAQTLTVEYLDAESDRDNDEGHSSDWEQKLASPSATSATGETRVEDQMMLGEALPQLRDLEKRAVTLFFFEDKSKTEVARALGISVNHAAYLIKRGIEGLRSIIENNEAAVASPDSATTAQWQKPALQRTRAAYLLEIAKRAAQPESREETVEDAPAKARRGRPARRGVKPEVTLPTAIPAARSGAVTFTEFTTWADDEVRRAARYAQEFSLLWLRIGNWDEVLTSMRAAESASSESAGESGESMAEKRAFSVIQALTRRCCRSTDKYAILSTGELPGMHVLILQPHTGAQGEFTGKRWIEACNASAFTGEENSSPVIEPRANYAFAVFPADGKTADELFRILGSKLGA
jgi:RNA polymerase sigma factor (sigma-70 family)